MLTNEQREQRRRFMGSSDTPIALGLVPWRNAADLQLFKTGVVPEPDGFPSEAAEIGTYLETGIAELAANRMGWRCYGSECHTNEEWPLLIANIDQRITAEFSGILEVKFSSDIDAWSDESMGSEGVPTHVLAQCYHQWACCPWAEKVYVAALLAGFGRHTCRVYEIARDQDAIDATARFASDWFQRHVIDREPVTNCLPALEIIRRHHRTTGKSIALDDAEPFLAWSRMAEERLAAEKLEDAAKARCLTLLGDAEVAETPAGTFSFAADRGGKRRAKWKGKT